VIDDLIAVARSAGETLMSYFEKLDPTQIQVKDKQGLVTEADIEAEKLIMARLREVDPSAAILTEESGLHEGQAEKSPRWIIDPLDGTSNFTAGIPWFAVSIGYETEAGSGNISHGVVYNPATQELFSAEKGNGAYLNGKKLSCSANRDMSRAMLSTGFYYNRGTALEEANQLFGQLQQEVLGVRRFGAAALDLAYVAAGRYDGFWERGLHPWDQAAGKILIEEAGGTISGYANQPYDLYSREILTSNGVLHEELARWIR